MPTKRKHVARHMQPRITPEAVEVYRAGDYMAPRTTTPTSTRSANG